MNKEKWCSAGKCECGCYYSERHDSKVGKFSFAYYTKACRGEGWEIDIKDIELCPWPSRQVPVEPPTYKPWMDEYNQIFKDGYAAGFRDALQKCREAVGEIKIEYYKFFISRPAVLAAISKVEEGMK